MTSVSRSLTSPDDWDREGYGRLPTRPKSDFQAQLDRALPKRADWSVLEIGACPGSQLLALALSHGYNPVALDYLPAVHQLPDLFDRFGVKNLEVIEHDFLTFTTPRRFNVVMSYGFIEHFVQPEEVIRRHWALVADGGFLVLGTPVFGPLQLALRRLVLERGQVARILRTHNRRIMNPHAIADVSRSLPGARVEMAAYAGHMDAWFRPSDSLVRRGRAWITVLWHTLGRIPRWMNWSSRLFSPLCLVIVRRAPADARPVRRCLASTINR
jgi:SAM-dependent methyltransferase